MKRLSQIDEGVFSDILKRDNGEEVRQEDERRWNIRKLKPVDLGSDIPVYFADIDLTVDDEEYFTWDQVLELLPDIEKTGWELPPGPKGMQMMFYSSVQPPKPRTDIFRQKWIPWEYGSLKSKETGEVLMFPTVSKYMTKYWCVDDDYTPGSDYYSTYRIQATQRGFEVGDQKDYYGCLIRTNNFVIKDRCKIRLIRDKKINDKDRN